MIHMETYCRGKSRSHADTGNAMRKHDVDIWQAHRVIRAGASACGTISLEIGYTAHESLELMCFLKIPVGNDSQSRCKYPLVFLLELFSAETATQVRSSLILFFPIGPNSRNGLVFDPGLCPSLPSFSGYSLLFQFLAHYVLIMYCGALARWLISWLILDTHTLTHEIVRKGISTYFSYQVYGMECSHSLGCSILWQSLSVVLQQQRQKLRSKSSLGLFV